MSLEKPPPLGILVDSGTGLDLFNTGHQLPSVDERRVSLLTVSINLPLFFLASSKTACLKRGQSS